MNRILTWARPRRWSILAEALTAALVALIALPVLLLAGRAPEPVRVVTDYLEALRDRDLDRAESLVSDEDPYEADTSWLTADAVSVDWEIESVRLKSATESTVHVVLSSGGVRTEGAFRLERTEGDLRIANPYVYLAVTTPLFASVEINGVRGETAAPDGSAAIVALYPGAYAFYGGVPEFGGASGDGGLRVVAVPGAYGGVFGVDAIDLDALLTEPVVTDQALKARVGEALAAWLDGCAESGEITPPGCPFGAGYTYGVAYDGHAEFIEIATLDWAVETYPRVRFDRDLRLEVVEPGTLRLTGTGTALGVDGATALDGRCTVDLRNVVPEIGDDGAVAFSLLGEQANTCI